MANETKKTIAQLFDEGEPIDRALQDGVHEAVLLHKRLGLPVVGWKDGKVVWIPADEIDAEIQRNRTPPAASP